MRAIPLLALRRSCWPRALRGCVAYEYEHEFWLRRGRLGHRQRHRPARAVDARSRASATAEDPDATATATAARALFERSGLRVRRVTLTRRGGRPYLFVSADFDDVNALARHPGLPRPRLSLVRAGEDRLHPRRDAGAPPGRRPTSAARDRDGLMAVRFHLPSKVYEHHNAADGVERGNIVGWRQDVAPALDGRARSTFGAVMDERSILLSTVALFADAIVGGPRHPLLDLLAVVRRGRRDARGRGRDRSGRTS